MRLFIPTIGTKLQLTKGWSFTLFCERRNEKLWKAFAPENWKRIAISSSERFVNNDQTQPLKHVLAKFPKDTVLKVDRIDVRRAEKSVSEHDCMDFCVVHSENKIFRKVRFWVDLNDVNSLECKVLIDEPSETIESVQPVRRAIRAVFQHADPSPRMFGGHRISGMGVGTIGQLLGMGESNSSRNVIDNNPVPALPPFPAPTIHEVLDGIFGAEGPGDEVFESEGPTEEVLDPEGPSDGPQPDEA